MTQLRKAIERVQAQLQRERDIPRSERRPCLPKPTDGLHSQETTPPSSLGTDELRYLSKQRTILDERQRSMDDDGEASEEKSDERSGKPEKE